MSTKRLCALRLQPSPGVRGDFQLDAGSRSRTRHPGHLVCARRCRPCRWPLAKAEGRLVRVGLSTNKTHVESGVGF